MSTTTKSPRVLRNELVSAELHRLGVVQIPDDVHRIFSLYGDEADAKLTADQKRRFLAAIQQARVRLRELHDEYQKNVQHWPDKDSGKFSANAGQSFWVEPDEPAPSLENPVLIFGPVAGGNYTRRRAAYKFGQPRGKESHVSRTA